MTTLAKGLAVLVAFRAGSVDHDFVRSGRGCRAVEGNYRRRAGSIARCRWCAGLASDSANRLQLRSCKVTRPSTSKPLFDRIRADHEQKFSIVDEEFERGLRALAVPVVDRTGQVIGAINLSTRSTRTTRNEMRELFLNELNRVAEPVSSTTV